MCGVVFCVCGGILFSSCRQLNFYSNSGGNANSSYETVSGNAENPATSPILTKEPETFRAKFVFISKIDADDESPTEQTTEIFRAGAKRRIDFELGANLRVSRLQNAEGKEFIIISGKKIFAEIGGENKNVAGGLPEDYTLEHLLHTKPESANYEKIGAETLNGKSVTKYRLNFGEVVGDANFTTETYLWVDETLGFPIKTEVVALEKGQPTNAKSTMEMREFMTEITPEIFEIPKDFKKVSITEINEILRAKS